MEATKKEVDRGWLHGSLKTEKCRPIDENKAFSSAYCKRNRGMCQFCSYHNVKCRQHGDLVMKAYHLHKADKNLPLSTEAVEEAYLAV